MTITRRSSLQLTIILSCLLCAGFPYAQELGTITFPTSASGAAQAAFVRGVKSLHSFEFDEAADDFREAQKLDPTFAMAYWGEAMSYNHPLWAQQDADAARKALERLAPSREARLAKAKLPKEQRFLQAVDVLYDGAGDKLARDLAYSEEMARFYAQYPDDHEVATFYALSLLGTVRPGDRGFRRQALAASIALKVFQENPRHPGAAHFVIHAFDDPEHAPLGLPAARAYAKIAPAAPHALHMPSHIFVQLGLWDDVKASNIEAYDAAMALIKRKNLPEGREDFHTLSWLAYAYEMLEQWDKALETIDKARAAADRNAASNPRLRDAYLSMKARYVLESRKWEKLPISAVSSAAGEAHSGMDHGYSSNADVLTAAGLSAAKMGDFQLADQAQKQLGVLRAAAESGSNANTYRAKPLAILEKEVAAAAAFEKGQKDEAFRLMKDAAAIEVALDPPSGPPDIIKPATELYGEMLLAAGRTKDAAQQFEQALLRTPNRTPSIKGLAEARRATGVTAR